MPAEQSDQDGQLQIARDKRLARRVLRGDQRAIKAFCDEYLPKLYRFALSRLPTEQDADDVVQVVLTNAARRMETYRGEAPLLGWLYQICRREVSKHLGAAARHGTLVSFQQDAATESAVAFATAPAADEPEVVSGTDQFAAQVHAALDQLPANYARALEMKYVDGYSSKEIAQRMKLADAAVQSLLARGRRAFRQLYDAADFGLETQDEGRTEVPRRYR
jgi:RNA polymerase sigma-70 factor (ECF subfamily)